MECEFCHKLLSNKYTLKTHIKTNKHCLGVQNGQNVTKSINGNKNQNKCIFCKKQYSQNYSLDRHLSVCVEKKLMEQKSHYEKKIMEQSNMFYEKEQRYLVQIKDLQDRIQELATKAIEKPTTTNKTMNYTNTTNIMNLAPLDMEELTKKIEDVIMSEMDENHIIEGQAGVARLLSGCFVSPDGKKLITCTDTSRGIWKSKDKQGNVIKDYKAGNIARVVQPIATKKADGIILDYDTRESNTKRIQELQKYIKEYSKEYAKEEENAICFSLNKESKQYSESINKMNKLDTKIQHFDKEIQEIMNSGLYDENHIISDDLRYKLYRGKKEIYGLLDDSTNFSKNLLTLI